MKEQIGIIGLLVMSFMGNVFAENQEYSKVWVSDMGNGRFRNPILNADYMEPDVCRVGNTFYMVTASGMEAPGLPLLQSKDLVNWELIGHVIGMYDPILNSDSIGEKGVRMPSLRYYKNRFYVVFCVDGKGVFCAESKDGITWGVPYCIKEGENLSEPSIIWDATGKAYLLYGHQHKMQGIANLLIVQELDETLKPVVGTEKLIYDGNEHLTMQNAKITYKAPYYYIFAPTGRTTDNRVIGLRSKTIFGPYEERYVMLQGKTNMEGPYVGNYVETPSGETWYLHNRHVTDFGQTVVLNPVTWNEGWPEVSGFNKSSNGEPVMNFKKPAAGVQKIKTPLENDAFDKEILGAQWAFNQSPTVTAYYLNQRDSLLRLYSQEMKQNLLMQDGILLEKLPGQTFTMTTKVSFTHNDEKGSRCGIALLGKDYAEICIRKTATNLLVSQGECINAGLPGVVEKENGRSIINQDYIWLRIRVKNDFLCTFAYSLDGEIYYILGQEFKLKELPNSGARIGFFCTHDKASENIVWADFDDVTFDK